MKLILILILTSSFSALAESSQSALWDDFKLDPDLKEGDMKYDNKDEKGDSKVFFKKEDEVFKVTSSKKQSGKQDVYQAILKKEHGKILKHEKLVKFDENQKIISLVKCQKDGAKDECQTFHKNFCDKLLEKKDVSAVLNENNLEKTLADYKKIYVEEKCADTDIQEVVTLSEETKQKFKLSTPENLKSLDSTFYKNPMVNFKIEKIVEDIGECEKLKEDFASEGRSTASKSEEESVSVQK